MPTNNLVQRIIVAAIAIPLVFGIIWLGGWVLAATLAILGVLGAREVYEFGRRQGIEPLDRTGWLAAAGIPLLAYWAKGSELHWAEPTLYAGALWLMLTMVMAMARPWRASSATFRAQFCATLGVSESSAPIRMRVGVAMSSTRLFERSCAADGQSARGLMQSG